MRGCLLGVSIEYLGFLRKAQKKRIGRADLDMSIAKSDLIFLLVVRRRGKRKGGSGILSACSRSMDETTITGRGKKPIRDKGSLGI